MMNNQKINLLKGKSFLVMIAIIVLLISAVAVIVALNQRKIENQIVSENSKLPFTATHGHPDDSVPQPYLGLISKNKALDYATVEYRFQGVIKEIDDSGGVVSGTNNKPYQLLLVVEIGSSGDTVPVSFPNEAMKNVRVYTQNNSGRDESELTDLAIGDLVQIKVNIGVLQKFPNNYNLVEITRIEP